MAGQSKRVMRASKSRSSGMKGRPAGSKPRPTANRNRRAPQIAGEKTVRATRATMNVKPLKVSPEAKHPMDDRAIDRRKQVFDDPAAGR